MHPGKWRYFREIPKLGYKCSPSFNGLTSFFVVVVVVVVLSLHSQHMEIPILGVKSELQLLAYTTATATWDLRYTTALGNTRSLTH